MGAKLEVKRRAKSSGDPDGGNPDLMKTRALAEGG
jgi:hypothetical protein